jgi:transcriptional regulator with XRE-family HTH domain
LAATVAGQLKRLREGRLSAQQLARKTAELGHEVPRSVIANLENGRRPTISVAEVIVLAQALGVPPLELLFPLGKVPSVEVLPNHSLDTWDAAKWFTGESHLPDDPDDRSDRLWATAAPAYFREQDGLVEAWAGARRQLDSARIGLQGRADRPDIQAQYSRDIEYLTPLLQSLEHQLRRHRVHMREVGLDPGHLSDELQHIDGGRDGER